MKKRVALIFGGEGYESDISVASADNLSELINTDLYTIVYTAIDKQGDWYIYDRRNDANLFSWNKNRENLKSTFPVRLFGESGLYTENGILAIDAAIPCLHGDLGEDGTIYALLTAAHIPFVGQDIYSAAFASDKSISKLIAKSLSIPTAKWVDARFGDCDIEKTAEKNLGYPMFVKPSRLGSSYGAHPVYSRDEFSDALSDAFSYCDRVIIEEYIDFKYEVECAYFDGEERLFSPHGRILSGKFYDFSAKYKSPADITDTDCGFDPQVERQISQYSSRLVDFMGLKHLSRLDFFVTGGDVYFNEINVFPGMTKTSLYPALSENMGLRKGEFINILIEKVINDRRI